MFSENRKKLTDVVIKRPDEHCTQCGCTLSAKARCLSCNCPLHKWQAVTTQDDYETIKQQIDEKQSENKED